MFFKNSGSWSWQCRGVLLGVMALVCAQEMHAGELNLNEYCVKNKGTVEVMNAQFDTDTGTRVGLAETFCTFIIDKGFIVIGLKTFGSDKANIAASYIKTLPELKPDSPLWQGPYSNPSLNVCKNLGGANIGFNLPSGGFSNRLGESDVCVFGDGSMVSGWSLIYMAGHRAGYDKIKQAVHSQPIIMKFDSGMNV